MTPPPSTEVEPARFGSQLPIDYPQEWPPGSGNFGPNTRQALAHQLAPHADELLYGGARGGGKTDFALAEALRRCLMVPGMSAVFFRRTYAELSGPDGAIPRLIVRIPRNVGRWNAQERRWSFHNGSTLTLSYLEKLGDVQRWLGLQVQLMVFDQVEQLDLDTYRMVRTSLRASGKVAAALGAAGMRPSSIATANPGGRGHGWVKARFIDPLPTGGRLFRAAPTDEEPNQLVRAFVPAKLEDNPALDQGDPNYRRILEGLGKEDRAAQLEGDWNVWKGARFAGFRTAVHVREPEQLWLPPLGTARRGLAIDYGSDHPFVALWGAEALDGTLIVYREVSGRGLSPAEQARLVLDAEDTGERSPVQPMPTVLDSACWAAPPDRPRMMSGPGVSSLGPRGAGGAGHVGFGAPEGSIAWTYQRAGVPVRQADKRRLEGTSSIASRLKVRPDGLPRLLISAACPLLISTLPTMQRDPARPEDYLKVDGDDAVDALRYLVMMFRGATSGTLDGERVTRRRPPGTGQLPASAGSVAARRRAPGAALRSLPTTPVNRIKGSGF